MTINVVVDNLMGTIQIHSTYDPLVVATIKSIPGRRWDPDNKVWTCPLAALPIVRALLTPMGARFIDADSTSTRTAIASGNWAADMFAALQPAVRERAYKALARVLHPDREGDTEAMQALNASWETYRAAS